MNIRGANIKEHKFSNGAMLNLIIQPNGDYYNLYLSLVYSGDSGDSGDTNVNKTDKKYWVHDKKHVKSGKILFKPITILVHKNEFKGVFKNNYDLKETISCYFVRHGRAIHNNYTRAQKLTKTDKNTQLVDTNDDSVIKNGGKALALLTKTINYIFVSDLIRTQQTAALFLQGYLTPDNITPDEIFVLPCLHELNKGQESSLLPYYENQTTCNHSDADKFYDEHYKNAGNPECIDITVNNLRKKFKWSEYESFFPEKHRTKENQKICDKDHFLGIALNSILGTTSTTGIRSLNGGKPKRTTRKSSKSQKPTTQRKPRKSRKSKH
jgi:hypothetical protein